MSRRTGTVCAGALLLIAAGCLPSSFQVAAVGPTAKPHVVDGSVDQVSVALSAALTQSGIAVIEKRQGREILLVGASRSGKLFRLRLERARTDASDRTAISVKWDTEADEQLWKIVLQAVPAAATATSRADRTS